MTKNARLEKLEKADFFRQRMKSIQFIKNNENNFNNIGKVISDGECLSFKFYTGNLWIEKTFNYELPVFEKKIEFSKVLDCSDNFSFYNADLFAYKNDIFYVNGHNCNIEHDLYRPVKKEIINTVLIQNDTLKNIIYACSQDTIKPIFNAIAFLPDGLSATDSRRLEFLPLPKSDTVYNVENEFLIALDHIKFILQHKQHVYKIQTNEKFWYCDITTMYGTERITGQLIDGKFPNVKQVIPTEKNFGLKQNFKIDNEKMLKVLNKLEKSTIGPAHKVILNFENDKLVISVPFNNDYSEIKDNISISTQVVAETINTRIEDIEHKRVAVNVHFLIESLKRFKKRDSEWFITGTMSPILIKHKGLISEYNSVIMPIQIRNEA